MKQSATEASPLSLAIDREARPRLWRPPRSVWVPPVLLTLLPLLLFWPLVVAGRVLYWGTPLLQFYPWREYAAVLYREGQLPLWNPYLGTGAPLAANLQSAVFYPINLLLFFTVPTEVGLGLSVMIHVALAGLFTYAFVRVIGLSSGSALLSAVSYMLSGYIIARAEFLSMTSAVPWLPLLLLAVDIMWRGARGRSRRKLLHGAMLLTAGSALLLLAGHAQLAFYALLFVVAYTVLRAGQLAVSRTAVIFSISVVLAVGLSFGVAAIQLVPTAELTGLSVRAQGAEREFALTYSLWPWQILGTFAPDAFGNPAAGDYWGPGNYWEAASYVGVLPLLLTALAVWRLRKASARRRVGWLGLYFAAIAVGALVLATGRFLPFFVFFYEHVPGFGSFQAPARLLFLYTFAVACLAGVGLELLLRDGPERAVRLGRLLGLVGVGMMAAAAVSMPIVGPVLGPRVTFVDALVRLGAMLVLSGLLVSLPLVGGRVSQVLQAMLGVWGSARGVLARIADRRGLLTRDATSWERGHPARDAYCGRRRLSWDRGRQRPPSQEGRRPAPRTLRITRILPARARAGSLARAPRKEPDRGGPLGARTYGASGGVPSSDRDGANRPRTVWAAAILAFVVADLLVFGVSLNPTTSPEVYRIAERPTIRALDASLGEQRVYTPESSFLDKFHRSFSFKSFGPSDGGTVSSMADLLLPNLSTSARVYEAYSYDPLQLADVRRLQQLADERLSPALLDTMAVRYVLTDAPPSGSDMPAGEIGGLSVLENQGALPRAFVSYAVEVVGTHEEALAAVRSDSFDPRRAIVLEGDAASGLRQELPVGPASIISSDAQSVVVQANAIAPGYLVLSDAFYPGWRVYVDGASAEMLRANYAFRAVRLQPGEHRVEFRYLPPSYVTGLALSLAALVVVVTCIVGALTHGARLRRQTGAAV